MKLYKGYSSMVRLRLQKYFSRNRFRDIELIDHGIIDRLSKMGIENMTPIQNKCIEQQIEGRSQNQMILSETGSGKTLCYSIPLINRLLQNKGEKTLILAPTKELCSQVYKQLRQLDCSNSVKISRTGSISYMAPIVHLLSEKEKPVKQEELNKLQLQNVVNDVDFKNQDILVSTPVQFSSLLEMRQHKDIEYPDRIIIDEFDLLLNEKNLRISMDKIIKKVTSRQKLDFTFCGASLPKSVDKQSAVEFIEQKYNVKLDIYKSEYFHQLPQKLQHDLIYVDELIQENKDISNKDILDAQLKNYKNMKIIIFCQSQERCNSLHDYLLEREIKTVVYHSGLNANQRMAAYHQFEKNDEIKDGENNILICSDLASRGMHFDNVEVVIQYDFASDATSLLHRIGRTCRLGSEGLMVSFVKEENKLLLEKYKEVIQQGQNISTIFSRKRSLSKKNKKQQS